MFLYFLQVAINSVTLCVSLLLALLTPGGAEKVYAVVGASGVCIICYVLPVCIHIKVLHTRRRQRQWLKRMSQEPSSPCGTVVVTAECSYDEAPLLTKYCSSSSSSVDADVIPAVLTPIPPPLTSPLLAPATGPAGSQCGLLLASGPVWLQWVAQLLVPVSVMCIGMGFSVAALMVAMGRL